jgi:hypothetical protein
LVEKPVNYISVSNQDNTKISYLNSDKIEDVGEKFWNSSRRVNIKPGAFVNKLFKGISEKEIEKFASLFKFIQTQPEFQFSIVSGHDIYKYYNYRSYAEQSSSLGNSCMKYDSCKDFLSIYVENTDKIKLLVLLNEDNLLIGRALLWETESHKIMDRIYTINDEKYANHFKKWQMIILTFIKKNKSGTTPYFLNLKATYLC